MNLPFSSVLHTNEGVFGEAIQGFLCLGFSERSFFSYGQDMFYQLYPLREKQVEELKEDELAVKNANLKSTHPLNKRKWNKKNKLNKMHAITFFMTPQTHAFGPLTNMMQLE